VSVREYVTNNQSELRNSAEAHLVTYRVPKASFT
jgi:hypothetical protein